MRTQKQTSRQAGFTILELLIATSVFSMVLLLCATAVVQVGQIFYKGVTINRTQDTARKAADDIIQAIQFGTAGSPFKSETITGNVHQLCLGNTRYTVTFNQSLGTDTGQAAHVVWKDRVSIANCSTAALGNGQELLGQNMRVKDFSVTQQGDTWKVVVTIAYGKTDDLFIKNGDGSYNYGQCIFRNQGGQFCAVSSITSYVAKRL